MNMAFNFFSKLFCNYKLHKKHAKSSRLSVELGLESNNFRLFDFDNKALLDELKDLGRFSYYPNPGNAGDGMIAKATFDFFDASHLPYDVYDSGYPKHVVYGGGGIWLNQYKASYSKPLSIFKNADRVVVLPSSVHEDCRDFIDQLDSRFTVFCREQKTYQLLLQENTGAKIILDHDMALRMTPAAMGGSLSCQPRWARKVSKAAEVLLSVGNVACLMRTDNEKNNLIQGDYDLSNCVGSTYLDPRDADAAAKFMLAAVDVFSVVVTDRLHVGIAALLMGKQVYLLDNSYGKLSGVYQHSLRQCGNVVMAESVPAVFDFPDTGSNNLRMLVERIYHCM